MSNLDFYAKGIKVEFSACLLHVTGINKTDINYSSVIS